MTQRWRRLQKGRVCNMQYHNITKDDMLNGDGLRVVLWVAGCTHGCKECQNPVTWDPNGGLLFDERAKKSCLSSWKKVISAESHTAEEIRCMWGTERRLPHLQKRSVKSSRKRHSGCTPGMSGIRFKMRRSYRIWM